MDSSPNTSPARSRAPSVKIAGQTFVRTLRHAYDNLGTLIIISVFWYISALVVLPLGVTTAALHRVTKPMTEERAANWRAFFTHLRLDLRWSSALFFVLLLGFIILQSNIGFYNASPSPILRFVGIFFWALLLIWAGIALYAFPITLRQEEPRLRTSLRNAAVMAMGNAPGMLVSLVLLLIVGLLLLVIPPLFMVLPGFIALWGEENVRLLLVATGYISKDEFADRERIKG